MKDPRIETLFHRVNAQDWKRGVGEEVVISSYPDDEGVRNNHGRAGAKDGPTRILYYLSRMVLRKNSSMRISVVTGFPSRKKILQRYDWAHQFSSRVLKSGARLLTLGGGHDYGYPDAKAYREQIQGSIINIDAHLDMRPFDAKKPNSGTAFRRYLDEFGGEHFWTWGAQVQCNADEMIEFAKVKKSKILSWKQAAPSLAGSVGVSVCLDAIEGIRGVSAPALIGLAPKDVFDFLIQHRERMKWLGLYECAPKLDRGTEDSARLAALLAYRYICGEAHEGRLF